MNRNHENMFEATKKLYLPTQMERYILYGMSLSDDEEDDEDDDKDDDKDDGEELRH